MKQLLFMVVALLVVSSAHGRKIRFTDSGNVWRQNDEYGLVGEQERWVWNLRLGPDTVAFGKVYKPLVGNGSAIIYPYMQHQTSNRPNPVLFREDTTLNKVWARIFVGADTNEYLIYNHNWKVGDSVRWHAVTGGKTGWIDGIDSTFFFNDWYRVFKAQIPHQGAFYIIEGIGSTGGPRYPAQPETFEISHSLTCFTSNGIRPIINPKIGWWFDNDESCALAVPNTVGQQSAPYVLPNPGTNNMVLNIAEAISSGRLTITNSIGQKIVQIDVERVNEVSIGQYLSAAGVYYYSLVCADKQYAGRFIFQ